MTVVMVKKIVIMMVMIRRENEIGREDERERERERVRGEINIKKFCLLPLAGPLNTAKLK